MLSYQDFQDFGRWYSARRLRETGRAASRHTLRTKQVHLASCARRVNAENEVFLATLLSDRGITEDLLDGLALSMTPGAMRQAVYALLDFARYAKARNLGDVQVLRTDVPGKNPMKPITIYTDEEMERFVSAARGVDLHWWAFITFLADTGRRAGEALELRWDWLKLQSEPPYFELPFQKERQPSVHPVGDSTRP